MKELKAKDLVEGSRYAVFGNDRGDRWFQCVDTIVKVMKRVVKGKSILIICLVTTLSLSVQMK